MWGIIGDNESAASGFFYVGEVGVFDCCLGDEEIKQNNIIKALKYQVIEKDLYSQWLEYTQVYLKWVNIKNAIVTYRQKKISRSRLYKRIIRLRKNRTSSFKNSII